MNNVPGGKYTKLLTPETFKLLVIKYTKHELSSMAFFCYCHYDWICEESSRDLTLLFFPPLTSTSPHSHQIPIRHTNSLMQHIGMKRFSCPPKLCISGSQSKNPTSQRRMILVKAITAEEQDQDWVWTWLCWNKGSSDFKHWGELVQY